MRKGTLRNPLGQCFWVRNMPLTLNNGWGPVQDPHINLSQIIWLKRKFCSDLGRGPRVCISNQLAAGADGCWSQAHTLSSKDLGRWFSRGGPRDHGINITWELVRNATSSVLSQIY